MQKLLASDFDNTLFVNEYEIIDNINAIKKFMENGNLFVIATGRSYIDISKMILKYNIPYNYLICNDGGTIFDNNGKLLYKKDIPLPIAHNIIEFINRNNLDDLTFIDTGYDYMKRIENEVNAIIIRDIDKNKSVNILNEITTIYPETHGYISDNWINITEKSVTKANGINWLINSLNISEHNVYTIGDTINDIPMIKKYNGACMVDSTNDLKSVCNMEFKSVKDYIKYIDNN